MAEKKKFLVGVVRACELEAATVGGVTLPKRDQFGVGTLAFLTDSEKDALVEKIKLTGYRAVAGGRVVDCQASTPGCAKLAEFAFVVPWDDKRDPEATPETIIPVDRTSKPQAFKSKAETRKEAAEAAAKAKSKAEEPKKEAASKKKGE